MNAPTQSGIRPSTGARSESVDELLEGSFLILDKPRGPSTHEVTAYIRKLLGVKKTGQMGTLDPQASGVIVVGIGKAVRLLRFVDMREKTYVGVMRTRRPIPSLDVLQREFDRQVGRITQVPPKHSAVAKRARVRKVYEFRALEEVHNTALFQSRVEAGTYIRVLCQAVGAAFGEGKMIELRRTRVGGLDQTRAVRLPELVDAVWAYRMRADASALKRILVPMRELISLPCLRIAGGAVEAIGRGTPLASSEVAGAEALEKGEMRQLIDPRDRLVAIARCMDGEIRPCVVLVPPVRRDMDSKQTQMQ